MLRQTQKTSYRAIPVESPSTYDAWGHYNRFGGFHRTTDPYAYFGLLKLFIQQLFKGHWKIIGWLWKRQLWYRWVHRSCDTTDFHHAIYCTLDPYVKRLDDRDRWHKVWTE